MLIEGKAMLVTRALGIVVLGLMVCVHASAQERKAYKHVDEKGNVTYSQTPPTQSKEVKKVDISPAHSGRGGYAGGSNEYRHQQSSSYSDQRSRAAQDQQKRREEAAQKRLGDLQAECNRNRGTDCNNPETLRLMEAQKIPGGRSYPPRY